MATANLGYQSFYQAQLTAAISDTDLTIPLDVVPTPSEGFLVLESTSATKREIIYYTSKTSNSVVCPAGGRGYDGTTAQSHTQNSAVIMAPVAAMFSSMRDLFETTPQGWTPVTQSVSSVTYNGNRSYSLTMSADVSATLSPGMRVRTTRTVSAPTQCTSLNGSTQYFNRTSASVTGMTFTDDFVVSAWVKLTSYGSTGVTIASRFNGTSGWIFRVGVGGSADGRVQLIGFNSGGANFSYVASYQSIPLNKWIHVAAQLDMSTFTATTTTSYIMIDGVDVPAQVTRGGTNPTALVQAGNLEIGSQNGGSQPFNGKIAQVAIFSAKVTQATIQGYISQGLAGTETNLISAYSFNNSINDLNTTNANNLTAQGSAVATNADSPFGTNSFGTETGTTDYGIITNVATTTVVVQVPEGCTIPTSGGVSAMSYSTQKAPYGMPIGKDKWTINLLNRTQITYATNPTANVWYNVGMQIVIPVGVWDVYNIHNVTVSHAGASGMYAVMTLSTGNNSETNTNFSAPGSSASPTSTQTDSTITTSDTISLTSATTHYVNLRTPNSATQNLYLRGTLAGNTAATLALL